MGEGCRSGFPQPRFDWQSPISNSLPAPLPFGLQSTNPPFINFGTNMVSSAGTLPVYVNPESPFSRVSQGYEPRGWFYCLPHFQQVLEPALNSFVKEQPLANAYDNCKESGTGILKAGHGVAEKRFLVFDQSADQTTLIFSSSFGTPTKCLTSWGQKSPVAGNLNGEDPIAKVNGNIHFGPISTDIFDENGTDVQSEMHENTEELNALLYSDDDGEFTEDDEVTSTGHSPCTMTSAQDEQCEGRCEEVANSTRLTKKRKLRNGSNSYSPLLMDTANSGNPNKISEYEDDAESSCANGQSPRSVDTDSSLGNKRMRKDKIRDTVRVLRSIIPGGEGKDTVVVLDEAIDYLKSLKHKAKTLRPGTL
ncbi:transcription factor bHLH145-like [Hibiscus syriacus]|nr:transcription factor bHLH145-like [Hibiscus syriacus]